MVNSHWNRVTGHVNWWILTETVTEHVNWWILTETEWQNIWTDEFSLKQSDRTCELVNSHWKRVTEHVNCWILTNLTHYYYSISKYYTVPLYPDPLQTWPITILCPCILTHYLWCPCILTLYSMVPLYPDPLAVTVQSMYHIHLIIVTFLLQLIFVPHHLWNTKMKKSVH